MILETVGILGLELTSSSSLFSSSEEEEGSGDAFLKTSAAETLLEEHLTMSSRINTFTRSRAGTRNKVE